MRVYGCVCVCSSSDSGLIEILRRGGDGVWNRAVTRQHPPGIRDREGVCVLFEGGARGDEGGGGDEGTAWRRVDV